MTGLPEALVRLLDQLCDEFEANWRAALREGRPRPVLAEWLALLPPEARPAGIRELLLAEWGQRRLHGERPTPDEYRIWEADCPGLRELLDAPPPPPDEPEADGPVPDGELIPGYRLMRRLGRGSLGEVFLASQLFSTPDDALRTVALKAIRPELVTSRRHRLIMENDIRIAALLDHPNIVPILHVGPAAGALFYTMPYLPGGSLAARIARKPMPWRDAATLLLPIARAVAHLHAQSSPVIHLDLKPHNVLLDADGTPFLADFGLARLLSGPEGRAVTQQPGGTPEYMAPEQFDGWVGPSCDIWGLGAILYEMLTGRPPFIGASWGDTRRQSAEREPVPPSALNPAVDRGLEAVCLKCLEKSPEHRYRSADELADDLARVVADEVPSALKVGWGEWLRRQLTREVRFDNAAVWSAALAWQSALSLPAYLSLYALLGLNAPAPLLWAWLLVLVPLAEWAPHLMPRGPRRPDPREREILLLWVSVCVAKAILFGLSCPLWGPVSAEEAYRFFPASMAVSGLMLCLEARLYWGQLYVVGLLDFVVAVLMMVSLPLAPLLFAVWNSAVLAWMAWQMHIRARRYALEDAEKT
jgi:serine/threonine-protein kinase